MNLFDKISLATQEKRRFLPLLGLLVVMLLGFGLFVPFLGFYWDDWPVLLTYRLFGAQNFWDFYSFDRPFSAWTYIVTLPVLGTSPLPWQIFTLVLRLLTALSFWWVLRLLWPAQRKEAAWAALLFAVYPVFTQQAASVAYSQHWICYLLYMFSVGCMLRATQTDSRSPIFLMLSLGAAVLHLLTMEYFVGVELLRPAMLWIVFARLQAKPKTRLRTTVLWSLPYLVLLVGFVLWRLVFQSFSGGNPNSPYLLLSLLDTPLAALSRLATVFFQDMLHLLALVWAEGIDPALFVFESSPFLLLSWGLAGLAGAATFFIAVYAYNDGKRGAAEEQTQLQSRASLQWLALGLLAALLGVLPAWSTDRQIIVGMYSDRFGLPAMFGASLVWVGLLGWLIADWRKRALLISILVALAVGIKARTMNDYRWSWTLQKRFYWQLSWRAPDIQSATPVFSDGEIFSFVGLYSTAAGINLLYDLPERSPVQRIDLPGVETDQLDYWFFSLGREFAFQMPEFLEGMPVESGLRMYSFQGNSKDGLVIQYDPAVSGCLMVLSPQDANLPDLPDITRDALPNANLSRILANPANAVQPSVDIFGPEPEHDWCYFYQKANLALQQQDWGRVAALGRLAQEAGHRINSSSVTPHEWLPFVEGYALAGDWSRAAQISQEIVMLDPRLRASLCDTWLSSDERAAAAGTSNPEVVTKMLEQLSCE